MCVFSKNKIFIALALLAVLTVSCKKESPVKPVLKGITVKVSEVVLDESAEIPFSVRDAGASFNSDVNSSECQLSLYFVSGDEEPFYLSNIIKGELEGDYIAVISSDGKKDFVEEVKLELSVANGTILSDAVTVKSTIASSYTVYTGLPIVYINTKGGAPINSKEDWVTATISISGLGEYSDLAETPISIKGRGNTTWTWPKKPYNFKFESKTEVLGLPKHKRWVLLANFMDRTLMRNALAFHLSELTSLSWTPKNRYCELILNGRHMGNYLLTEQIRADKNRVDIDEDHPLSFLFESDFHYDNEWQWREYFGSSWQGSGNIPFSVKFPDDDELTQEGFDAAKSYIHNILTVLYGSGFDDPTSGYRAHMDMDSFVDFWIVYELMGNHELNNPGSIYSYVDSGGKWTAGPVWDFDWGGLSYSTSPQAKTGLVCWDAVWYARLNDDPWFRSKLSARWNELLPLFRQQTQFIDDLKLKLTKSAALNFAMWNPAEDASQNGGRIINGDENMSFSDAVDRLRKIYTERLDVISSHL